MTTEIIIPYVSEKIPSLKLPDNLRWEKFQDVIKEIQKAGETYRWLLGDAINFGVNHYPDKIEQLELFAASDVEKSNARKISAAFPPESRTPQLTYRHAEAILTEANPERLEHWVTQVQGTLLTVPQLRKAIRQDQSEVKPEDKIKLESWPGEELVQVVVDFSIQFKRLWNDLAVVDQGKVIKLIVEQIKPVTDVFNQWKVNQVK